MSVIWIGSKILKNAGGDGLSLSNLKTSDGQVDGLQADSLPGLVQALGYLKKTISGGTYLRGQSSLYHGKVEASLMRDATKVHARHKLIDDFVESAGDWICAHSSSIHRPIHCHEELEGNVKSSRLLGGGVPRYAAEPLLQHYGIRTRWIDVVDNIWTALWFACHKFIADGRYMHVVKRNISDDGDDGAYIISVTLEGTAESEKGCRGLWRYPDVGRVIDLRVAAPSYYVRPHAQHGYLIRPTKEHGDGIKVAAIRIPLGRALEWLGSSVLLSPFGIYPPATVDVGYRRLLDRFDATKYNSTLGAIRIVGPGY